MQEAAHELTETQNEERYPVPTPGDQAGTHNSTPLADLSPVERVFQPRENPVPVPPALNVQHTPSPATLARIRHNLKYHAPKGNQATRYNAIRETAFGFACLMAGQAPESRELSLALTHLEEAVMWVNAAIARNE